MATNQEISEERGLPVDSNNSFESFLESTVVRGHHPPGVTNVIAWSGDTWVGQVDDTTVLKYPREPEDIKLAQVEANMLAVLGYHPHIVQAKGLTTDGLLLEYAPNGTLRTYLADHQESSLEQRLAWCIQVTEALAHAHSKRVLHCDIRHDNCLLDADLSLRLSNFHGQHFSAGGEVLLDGLAVESIRAYLPRNPVDHASVRTDLFALGSLVHFIITGQEVFPDPHASQDHGECHCVECDEPEDDKALWWEEEISRRFRDGEFPADSHVCATITENCWRQVYSSAEQVRTDLELVQKAVSDGVPLDTIAKETISVLVRDDSAPAPSWLDGLCDEEEAPKIPPQSRELTGFQ